MSRQVYVVITCDGDGCDARFTAGNMRADRTRLIAIADGWTYELEKAPRLNRPAKSYDYCPKCNGTAAAPRATS